MLNARLSYARTSNRAYLWNNIGYNPPHHCISNTMSDKSILTYWQWKFIQFDVRIMLNCCHGNFYINWPFSHIIFYLLISLRISVENINREVEVEEDIKSEFLLGYHYYFVSRNYFWRFGLFLFNSPIMVMLFIYFQYIVKIFMIFEKITN